MSADSISVVDLQEILAERRPVTVLDIRTPADREWSIPGSINVDAYDSINAGRLGPLAEVGLFKGPVVTVCGVGRTAATATELLRSRGVEAMTLEGGMRSWSLAWNIARATVAGCEVVQVRRTGKGCLSYMVVSMGEVAVIDASVDVDVYVGLLEKHGWHLVSVVDTHVHADHLSRSKLLAERTGAELYLPPQNRITYAFHPVADGERISFGSAELVAWHTPGHTAESTTFVLGEGAAFSGDTLFISGVGRPDLEGGDPLAAATRARSLHGSIKHLLELPADALVLPGHVSDPIPFDGRLLTIRVGTIRDTVALTRLDPEPFVEAVLARIPPSPPNHARIVELNERGELPNDPGELEAGPNRCAIA